MILQYFDTTQIESGKQLVVVKPDAPLQPVVIISINKKTVENYCQMQILGECLLTHLCEELYEPMLSRSNENSKTIVLEELNSSQKKLPGFKTSSALFFRKNDT